MQLAMLWVSRILARAESQAVSGAGTCSYLDSGCTTGEKFIVSTVSALACTDTCHHRGEAAFDRQWDEGTARGFIAKGFDGDCTGATPIIVI